MEDYNRHDMTMLSARDPSVKKTSDLNGGANLPIVATR